MITERFGVIDVELLTSQTWRYRSGDGHIFAQGLKFDRDGVVSGSGVAALSYWGEDNGDLIILTDEGHVFARFPDVYFLNDRPRLIGSCNFVPFQEGVAIVEKANSKAAILEHDDDKDHTSGKLNISSVLTTGQADKLIVIFNSAGRPFDGWQTGWEFHNLPYFVGFDYVRVSEDVPRHWYLRDTDLIIGMLHAIAFQRYNDLIFCGMSSGGYASMFFAEKLANRLPNIRIRSYSINPQVDVSPDFWQENLGKTKHFEPPYTFSEDQYAARDCDTVNVGSIIKDYNSQSHAFHSIFYDSENGFEAACIGRLPKSERIRLLPFPMGKGHFEGAADLYRQNVVLDAILADHFGMR